MRFPDVVGLASAAALRGLRQRELEHLGALLSARAGTRGAAAQVAPWLASSLPSGPGRILVGHCGAGELLPWLVARGFAVEAFDPSPALVQRARERMGGRARIDVLDCAGFIAAAAGRGLFDAVVLSGGGFARCLTATARASLLRACISVCPRGPIVLTWPTARAVAGDALARRVGARLGGSLAALRGLPGDERQQLVMLADIGPVARIEPTELAALAARFGCRLHLPPHEHAPPHEDAPLQHATLVPQRRARELDMHHVATELLADVMAARGHHRMVARGASMTPAIPSGAQVELVRAAALDPGDVVAARVHGSLFVHRIVGVDAAGQVLLQGDACRSPDGWVAPRDVLGRVASIDDGDGRRAVPATQRPVARWRRGMARLRRALRALA